MRLQDAPACMATPPASNKQLEIGAGLFKPDGSAHSPRNPKKEGLSMPFPRASQGLSRFTVLNLIRVRSR